MTPDISPGQSFPLGATVRPGGVNFCIFSKNCQALELLLFDAPDAPQAARVIRLDPKRNKTFYYWHVFVPGIDAGQVYAYRAYGPFDPAQGHRFDGDKVLLDPYARVVVVGDKYCREAAIGAGDNCAQAMRGVVLDPSAYDWEGDIPLLLPFAHAVIYELHVGGFTRHPSSAVSPAKRGTYAGLVDKIPYLKSLGITAVELMPVQQFDEQDVPRPLKNYWGYNSVAFFAPHCGYSSRRDPLGPVNEFRDMVKAFHRAGIEVILDVVFNHTAEGDHSGPTLSFRGLENRAYYILEADRALYANYSGCGNTVNGNQSIVRRMIMDCLHHWVAVMHVDGFRFDLASVLARDEWGQPLKSPPLLWDIDSDPVLAGTKIIAEAWDAAGLYQVGSFVGHRWAEWNGQFRDDVRRFVKSDLGSVGRLAARLTGSPDLYPQVDREPNRSINFVSCHDGFTLNDLVSYNAKHNETNAPADYGGTDFNLSWNCGEEGPSDDPQVEALRLRQVKNFLTILFVSQGTPMLLMGDELRRSQQGNNNAYCQDNELSWFDWSELGTRASLLRFVRGLIRFTQAREIFREERFWVSTGQEAHLTWHGVRLGQPDWSYDSHSLAFELHHPGTGRDEHLHVMLNAYWEPLSFELPPLPAGQQWHRIVNTALPSPDDFSDSETAPPVKQHKYRLEARSAAILLACCRR
ncbi:MAG: glycogen debranching protein GlgX [Thermoflexales bacterium]|nr:glycogen debranching protein GlgX [Thermoflexales bacterium]